MLFVVRTRIMTLQDLIDEMNNLPATGVSVRLAENHSMDVLREQPGTFEVSLEIAVIVKPVGTPETWWIGGKDVTDQVEAWIFENDLPDWRDWDERTKTLFTVWFA
jgi:hypothetical protein